jgi:hypothetical protein
MPLLTAARTRKLAVLAVLVASSACGDESEDAPKKPEAQGDISMVSFEAMAYFDVSTQNARIIERIRREKESVVFALRRRQIAINSRKQVDVELKKVIREPVSVLDPESGARRPALRVRYWFVGFGGMPAEWVALGDVPFGLLHTDDASREPALRACLLDDASGEPIWQRFEPSRESCKMAIDAEQKVIDAARAKLGAKDTEIVPLELDRLYLPIALHVTPRNARPKSAADAGVRADFKVQGGAPERPGEGTGPPSGAEPSPGIGALFDKLRERALAESQAQGDLDEPRSGAPTPFVIGGSKSSGEDDNRSPSAFIFNEPNFALLWGVALVMVIIAANEYRRRQRRRGIPERQERRRQRR